MRRFLIVLLVLAGVYYVYTSPGGAADMVSQIVDFIFELLKSVTESLSGVIDAFVSHT